MTGRADGWHAIALAVSLVVTLTAVAVATPIAAQPPAADAVHLSTDAAAATAPDAAASASPSAATPSSQRETTETTPGTPTIQPTREVGAFSLSLVQMLAFFVAGAVAGGLLISYRLRSE